MDISNFLCSAAAVGMIFFAVIAFARLLATSLPFVEGVYRKVAIKRDGQLTQQSTTTSRGPSIYFRHNNAHVVVDIQSTNQFRQHYTRLQVVSPNDFRCEVFPQRIADRDQRFKGTQDIKVGSRKFDKYYIIRGNDEHVIPNLINKRVRRITNQIGKLARDEDIYLLWNYQALQIKVRGVIDTAKELDRFITLGLRLFDASKSTKLVTGIEFVDKSIEPDLLGGICQVCGDEIQANPVKCRSCRTQHHRDCWEYFGKCSTYGCGQKRFRKK